MVSKSELGQRMKARRRRLGLSQEEVALRVPTSRPNYTNWENGKVDIAASDLQLVAEALEVPMSYFFPEDQDEWAPEGEESAFFNGMAPDDRETAIAVLKVLREKAKRAESTIGPKAE